MKNPYAGLADHHFWQRSITLPAPGLIDPVVGHWSIGQTDRVATMGSCFAQHLSKRIAASGFNYFVAEPAPDAIEPKAAAARQFGTFSARYGNIYTIRQAIQLFDRAFADVHLEDHVWRRGDRYVDAFRPLIEPQGFGSEDAVLEDRARHLRCVRDLFEKSDWLIFTLGLTEAWRAKSDGAIFPSAPGVAGGVFDDTQHEFVNFTISQTLVDLAEFVDKATRVNPGLRIILTVSPVPLIATYEPRHVLVSTVASKSILRAAADEIERTRDNVIYFPSYEIITSPAAGGRYYQDDLREVTEIGVGHVMRVFFRHFMQAQEAIRSGTEAGFNLPPITSNSVVCDEEEIVRALKTSGFERGTPG